jgi:hypothetical protein
MKHIGLLFLLWCGSTNICIMADMTCVHWQQISDYEMKYSAIPTCFYDPVDLRGHYCIVTNTSGLDSYDKTTGLPCDETLGGDCMEVEAYYVNVGEAGCEFGSSAAILPVGDTILPFLLLTGGYGLFIYRRKKKYRPAI